MAPLDKHILSLETLPRKQAWGRAALGARAAVQAESGEEGWSGTRRKRRGDARREAERRNRRGHGFDSRRRGRQQRQLGNNRRIGERAPPAMMPHRAGVVRARLLKRDRHRAARSGGGERDG